MLKLSRIDFKSKKIKVNLNQPIKSEVKAESTDVLKTVDEDRKYAIQATIVRYVIESLVPLQSYSLTAAEPLFFTVL